jgi:hypothetical protein
MDGSRCRSCLDVEKWKNDRASYPLAQMVERKALKLVVVGSSPTVVVFR